MAGPQRWRIFSLGLVLKALDGFGFIFTDMTLSEPASLEWFLLSREGDQRVCSSNTGPIILSLSGKV